MKSIILIILITTSVTCLAHECGSEGYTVTNYKNRGYLKLHKKGSNLEDCFKCWKSGEIYDVPYEAAEFTEYKAVCSDDPKFYQVTTARYS